LISTPILRGSIGLIAHWRAVEQNLTIIVAIGRSYHYTASFRCTGTLRFHLETKGWNSKRKAGKVSQARTIFYCWIELLVGRTGWLNLMVWIS
jgi:hypothetical protein